MKRLLVILTVLAAGCTVTVDLDPPEPPDAGRVIDDGDIDVDAGVVPDAQTSSDAQLDAP